MPCCQPAHSPTVSAKHGQRNEPAELVGVEGFEPPNLSVPNGALCQTELYPELEGGT